MLPITNWHQWTDRIHASNQAKLRMQYPVREGSWLNELCVTLPLSCPMTCRCRALGNRCIVSLRPDITYDRLEYWFSQLFVKGISRHNWVGPQNGAPAAHLFDQVKAHWGDWLNGQTFAEAAHSIQRTIFCTDAYERAAPFLHHIHAFGDPDGDHLGHDTRGIYRSKMAAISLPDLAIPFDGKSARLQRQHGYNPHALGEGRMASDLADFITQNQMTIHEMRLSDDARSVWAVRPAAYDEGTCLNRPIDKQWYGHP